MDLRQGAQDLGMKEFVGRQIRYLYPQQVFDGAGDIMALAHLWRPGNGTLEERVSTR